jgi:hypothetical protein
MTDELQKIMEEINVAYLRSQQFLGGTEENGDKRSFGPDSNRTPPEYKSTA